MKNFLNLKISAGVLFLGLMSLFKMMCPISENQGSVFAFSSESQAEDFSNESESLEEDQSLNNGVIDFCLAYMESLPNKGEENFDKFLQLPSEDMLAENRDRIIEYKYKEPEHQFINEKEVYKEIETVVQQIIKKVEDRTPSEDMSREEIERKIMNNEISKHYNLPKQMRIAKAIYRFVAKNIFCEYDRDTVIRDQGAISVYKNRKAICQGYARLINLMMRLAGIPSAFIESREDLGREHAYNAIYLEDLSQDRCGWTLLDVAWGGQIIREEVTMSGLDGKSFLPAFYNPQNSFENANISILKLKSHKITTIENSIDLHNELIDTYYSEMIIDGIAYFLAKTYDLKRFAIVFYAVSDVYEGVWIPKKIIDFNLPFKISGGIKSVILTGDEVIEEVMGEDLEYIDTTCSNKHIFKDGILYTKQLSGEKGKQIWGM